MCKSLGCLLSITLIVCCTLSVYAQTISPEFFENEEDLKDALERNVITYEEYLELLDLMLSKVQSGSEEEYKLLIVPGISLGNIAEEEDEEKKLGFIREFKDKLGGRATWRTYQKLQEEEEKNLSHRLYLNFSHSELFHFKGAFSQQGEGSFQVRNRSVRFILNNSSNIIIGNYDKRFGLGINIGYFSFLNYIRDDTLSASEQFLYPLRARYNGILVEHKFNNIKTSFFYSANRWSHFKNWLLGGDFTWSFRKVNLGLTFSQAQMKRIGQSTSYEDRCVSLHLGTKFKITNLLMEYAKKLEAGDGLALVLLSKGKNYSLDWSFWNYASDFVHLSNGGPSQSDYERIDIEEIDYSYCSRQAGEEGVNFISRYKILPSLKVNWGYSQWSENRDLPKKIRAKVGIGYSLSKKYSFALERYWMDNSLEQEEIDGEKTRFIFRGSSFGKFKLRIIADYGEKMLKSGKKKYGSIQLKVNSTLFSYYDFTLWLKCYDPNFDNSSDNIWRFYLEQKVEFFKDSYFVLGYALKYSKSADRVEDKAIRTKLSIDW